MNAPAAVATELLSHHVKPDELPWQDLAFPGCQIKSLFFDGKSGMATMLFRMAPGAELPDHEHVLIEQTYVLEGTLVDKDGPEAGLEIKAGEFVWRPAGSRHAAYSPDGGTMLAIFQIPNRFFDREGRATDASGRDWQQFWGHLLPK